MKVYYVVNWLPSYAGPQYGLWVKHRRDALRFTTKKEAFAFVRQTSKGRQFGGLNTGLKVVSVRLRTTQATEAKKGTDE